MTDLKITQQQLENQQLLLTIEVPDQRVDKAMRAAAKKIARQYRIPGFRPGKAPYHVVVSRFGREALMADVADEMGQDIFKEALDAAELDPYAQATLRNITFDPLTYEVEVPLPPETNPNNYRDIRVPFPEPSEEAITEAVQKEIDEIRERYKTWQPVERPVEYGDLVTISLKITIDDEVVLENDDWDIVPDAEDYTIAPEFDTALMGMSTGETKAFTTTFPEDGESPWEGEEGHLEIEILGVKSEEPPEMDDELATEVGDYETFDELKADITERVQNQLQFQAEGEYREVVLDAMTAEATLAYPPTVVEHEIDRLIEEQASYFRGYGIESTEEYLRIIGKTEEEYREQMRSAAITRVERRLALDAIVEQEQFEISDYELDQYLEVMLSHDPEQLSEVLEQIAADEDYRSFIISLIKRERAEKLLIEIAKGEEVPEPGEHPVLEAPSEEESVEESPTDDIEEASTNSDEDAPESTETEEISQSELEEEDTLEA